MTPKISVVMPVWNIKNDKLIRSIMSIRNQTFTDYEFIIVCDEPTKDTQNSCNIFKQSDPRIMVINNPTRQGLSKSLNQGFAIAKGKYIARMDADDLSYPDRLQKQYDFMEAHHKVGISGTAHYMHRHGHTYKTFYPNDIGEIHSRLMFGPCLAHPTVIFRSSFIKNIPGPYDPNFLHAEDYELWVRCADKTIYSNLNDLLVYIENDGDNVSDRYLSIQMATAERIHDIAAKKFGFPPRKKDIGEWLKEIYATNQILDIFPKDFFNQELGRRWYFYCLNCRARHGFSAWFIFRNHPLSRYAGLSLIQRIKFFAACLIKWRPQ